MMKNNYQEIYGDLSQAILSEKELNENIIKYQATKDSDALTKIVKSNLRLIIKIAEGFKVYNLDTSILVDCGVIGLIKALDKFDVSKGVRLSVFANQNIRREMLDEIQKICTTVSVSEHYHKNRNNYKKLLEKYKSQGKELTDEEAMKNLGISQNILDKIKLLVSINTFQVPIMQEKNEDDEHYNNTTQLVAEGEDFLDIVINNEKTEKLYKALNKEDLLTEQERDILYRKFGLKTGREETLQQIADRYGVSKERIHQIKKKALAKLRIELEEK